MRRFLIPFVILVVFALPVAANAASFLPLVPCGTAANPKPCTPCDLFAALKHTIDLVLYGITGPVAAFMFVYAGALFLLYGANPTLLSQAKKVMFNTLLGVAIVLLSWLGTNTLIKTLASGSTGDRWFEFSCPAFLTEIQIKDTTLPPVVPGPGPVITPSDFTGGGPVTKPVADTALAQKIAQLTGAHYPRQDSSALVSLRSCLLADPIVNAMTNKGALYSFEQSNEYCNYTRGHYVSGVCPVAQHAADSCHYGGKTGTDGAEAVDFNAVGGYINYPPGKVDKDGKLVLVKADTEALFCQMQRVLITSNKCGTFKFLNWEGNHIHVSTNKCDKDGNGQGYGGKLNGQPITHLPTCGSGLQVQQGAGSGGQ